MVKPSLQRLTARGSLPGGQFLPGPLLKLGADWLSSRQSAALAAASVLPMMRPTLIDGLRCSLRHQALVRMAAGNDCFDSAWW